MEKAASIIRHPPKPSFFKRTAILFQIYFKHLLQFTIRLYDFEYFWFHIADLWMDIEHYHKAIQALRKAGKISTSFAVQQNIGWCYLRLGMPQLALPHLEDAWKINKNPNLALYLADCHLLMWNTDEAGKLLDYHDGIIAGFEMQIAHDHRKYYEELRSSLNHPRI